MNNSAKDSLVYDCYGVKVQLLVTKNGIRMQSGFVPCNEHDSVGLEKLQLPTENKSIADPTYTSYVIENKLMENDFIALIILLYKFHQEGKFN